MMLYDKFLLFNHNSNCSGISAKATKEQRSRFDELRRILQNLKQHSSAMLQRSNELQVCTELFKISTTIFNI